MRGKDSIGYEFSLEQAVQYSRTLLSGTPRVQNFLFVIARFWEKFLIAKAVCVGAGVQIPR